MTGFGRLLSAGTMKSGDASPTRNRLSARAHANGVDRISNLPEQIISNILSFLPTKNAVATSVLSKTWKLRWTRLASFDVDDQLWPDWAPTIWTPKKDFVGFVKMILQNQTADSRNRFRLRCHPRRSPPKLPGELYISKHLRVLKLAGPVLIHAPNRGCLPKLAVLELDSVNYESDESFRNLILGCPMLQSLIVKRTSEKDNLVVCTISSATLKLLDVHFTFEIDDHLFDSWGVMKLQIDAPALESLLIYDVAPKQISVEKLPSLREVDLEIAYCAGDMVVDLIQAVNGVKFMTLGPSLMDTLTIAPTPNKFSATFERLTRLVVLFDPYEHWGCLADLIDCCVKLEVIELMIYKPESSEEPESEDESKDGSEDESKDGSEDESKDKFDSKGKHWMESARVPTCFYSSLRHVTMKGFYEDKGLMAMLKFFLDHGVLMERVNLCFANGNEHLDHEIMSYDDELIAFKERCRLLSKVLMLSRASPACKVNVGIS